MGYHGTMRLKYHNFFDSMRIGLVICSQDFLIKKPNRISEQKFQIRKGQSILDFIKDEEDFIYFQNSVSKAKSEDYAHCYLKWHTNLTIFYVDLFIYHVEDGHLLIHIHDVTELKRLYLRQLHILNALDVSCGLMISDWSGRIEHINAKFVDIVGYSEEEIQQKSLHIPQMLHISEQERAEFWSKLHSGQICLGEGEILSLAQSHKCWVRYVISPIFDDNKKPIGHIEMVWDITAQKNAEWQAIQVAKMAVLGEMASGVAHEINNPLSVISGRASLIKKKLLEMPNTEGILEHVAKIQKQVDRISRIINGLRSFARSSGPEPKTKHSLNRIIEDSVDLVFDLAQKRGVKIEVKYGNDYDVLCRPIQISQILVNLLHNAIDAVAELEERWIEVEVEDDSKYIHIHVTDSGRGIPPDIASRMMQPFFTTKPTGQGTGLGLSLSKGIAEEHGGDLCYQDQFPNTRFTLILPHISSNLSTEVA
ncbi:MAG: ATP-binding protein [Bdellovibrionaceae bacterium]|nr:ATP-binding protein [Pseudobdellovibrionaceae bacterium]MDW8190806.1 ATP-binding protein [Pseudobdellovibrionaceae bacterium]